MYASLTTVRGGGPDVSTTARMAAESMLTWLREFDGYRGLLVLGDPETGNARIVSFWDSEEALDRSEKSRREVRESMVSAAGAELDSVVRYELFLGQNFPTGRADPSARHETPAVARFTTFEGPPASIQEGLRTFREDLVDWFRDATGFRGWLALLDVPEGKSIGITFWATQEALDDDSASGAVLRNEIAAGLDTEVTSVELYEVMMIDLVTPDEAG
jgi:heme-degrading monooxygenase HmoA